MGELGLNEIRHLDALPLVLDQQILAGGKTVDALGQALHEDFWTGVLRSLLGHRPHHREQVFGAMVHFSHQQTDMFLETLAFRKVIEIADDAKPAAGNFYPLELPVIGFFRGSVRTLARRVLGMIALSGFKRVAKPGDDLAG